MGLLLDLAVAALAVAVAVSLGLLAWTLGVTATRRAVAGRGRIAAARRSLAEVEPRIRIEALRARNALRQLIHATSRTQGDR